MSTKLGHIAGILIFALVVTLPPIVGLFTSNDIQTMERRKAAALPALKFVDIELNTFLEEIFELIFGHACTTILYFDMQHSTIYAIRGFTRMQSSYGSLCAIRFRFGHDRPDR